MLNSGDRFRIKAFRLLEAEEQRVLPIPDDWNDFYRSYNIGRRVGFRVFIFRFCPIAGSRIDVEAKDGLILPALQAFVELG